MKLTVLGRYGKYPNKNGATCSYLVESKSGAKIILDMGSGSLKNLANVCAYEDIDAVVISHFHGDHCADAFVFRNIALEQTKKGLRAPISFFMPEQPQEEYYALSSCEGFAAQAVCGGMKTSIKDFCLEFFEMSHTLPTFGVRVTDGEKCLAYTADTTYTKTIKTLVEGCDLALVDACILQREHSAESPHISVYGIAELTKSVPVTILTHLSQGREDETLSEALGINKNARLAEELITLTL
ncbi:MAG: MBL fold metallo-hydrolase [Clostridia bacterium]|nr:MBL fold metallo-hydrolase [Clostridia bacterium]